MACATLMYRSTLIQTRRKILERLHVISKNNHTKTIVLACSGAQNVESDNVYNIHIGNGMNATNRSETAKARIKQLLTVRRCLKKQNATTTKRLPIIANSIIEPIAIPVTTL